MQAAHTPLRQGRRLDSQLDGKRRSLQVRREAFRRAETGIPSQNHGKLPLEEYWEKFPQKRPQLLASGETAEEGCTGSCGNSSEANAAIYDNGDNIYEKLPDGTWVQHPNGDHTEADKERDLSGVNALICDEFCYFGADSALDVPHDVFGYAIPRLKKIDLNDAAASRLIAYARQHAVLASNLPE